MTTSTDGQLAAATMCKRRSVSGTRTAVAYVGTKTDPPADGTSLSRKVHGFVAREKLKNDNGPDMLLQTYVGMTQVLLAPRGPAGRSDPWVVLRPSGDVDT